MNTIFNGTSNTFKGDILLPSNNITQTLGTLSNVSTSSKNLIVKSGGSLSFTSNSYIFMSDRLRITTNTGLDTLYSELMLCKGLTSNTQTFKKVCLKLSTLLTRKKRRRIPVIDFFIL